MKMKWDCKSGGDLDRHKIHSISPHQSHTLSEERETSQWEKMRKLDRKVKPGKKMTFYYEKTREVKEKIRNESRHFPFQIRLSPRVPGDLSHSCIFLSFSPSQLTSAVCLPHDCLSRWCVHTSWLSLSSLFRHHFVSSHQQRMSMSKSLKVSFR